MSTIDQAAVTRSTDPSRGPTTAEEERLSSQWQSIATAPMDRPILVGVWVMYDDEPTRWSCWVADGVLGCDGVFGDEPTHWRDVPLPPSHLAVDAQSQE